MDKLTNLVKAAVADGRVPHASWVDELMQQPGNQVLGTRAVVRDELVTIYSRRARREPDNGPLTDLKRELIRASGDYVLLAYLELESHHGHIFVDETASRLLGVVLKSHVTPLEDLP
ncbi:hypothetical protein [Microcella sp.]|uniref:hypothetical protein n=1 Tax=Microcella sp. TaxID=1913979 RepID=UPI00391936EB